MSAELALLWGEKQIGFVEETYSEERTVFAVNEGYVERISWPRAGTGVVGVKAPSGSPEKANVREPEGISKRSCTVVRSSLSSVTYGI